MIRTYLGLAVVVALSLIVGVLSCYVAYSIIHGNTAAEASMRMEGL